MNNFNSSFIILLSVGVFFFFTKPMMAGVSDLSSKKDKYQETLANLNSVTEIQRDLTEKLNNLKEEDRAKLVAVLPDSPGTVKLISDISAMAAKYAISIDQVSYQNQSSSQASSIAEALPQKSYQSVVLDLSFSADYARLKNFLTEIESSLRLIDIRNIDISIGEKGVYTYKVRAEFYSL